MPRKRKPKFVYLLNVGLRSIERWLENQPERPPNLSSAQAGTLFYLLHNDGALIGEVAQALLIGASAMSGMANRMEQAGLLTRSRDAQDGRAMRLYLTEQGRQVSNNSRSDLMKLNSKLSEGFSEAEMEIVARWLELIPCKLELQQSARDDFSNTLEL